MPPKFQGIFSDFAHVVINQTGETAIASDHDLDRRLDSLKNKLAQQDEVEAGKKEKASGDNNGMAQGLKIASEFVSAILVGGAIGWVLDQWLGWSPFGIIIFVLLGFVAGIVNVMRVTGRMSQRL